MTNAVFDLPEILTSLNTVSVFVRLALAVAFGGILGLERGRKHRPAGFRTYMIVCLSSALIMITDLYLVEFYGTGDPARLGAQVISGIGFLGAGSIMISNMRIKGITTAAGLWGSAGLGLAIGAGFYIGA
ncbi:MAG: MgtC/SapB family protein, partial [Treponema socranskii subsp. buccale]